jgi:hypothetical protein
MKKRNEKTNTGEGDKGKRGRTASDDVGGKSFSDTSTSAGAKSTAIHTSVNIFEESKRDKPQYFVDKVLFWGAYHAVSTALEVLLNLTHHIPDPTLPTINLVDKRSLLIRSC